MPDIQCVRYYFCCCCCQGGGELKEEVIGEEWLEETAGEIQVVEKESKAL